MRKNIKTVCLFALAIVLGVTTTLAFTPRTPDVPSVDREQVRTFVEQALPDTGAIRRIAEQAAHDEATKAIESAGLDAQQINQTVEDAIIAFIKTRAGAQGEPTDSAQAQGEAKVDVDPIDVATEPVAGNAQARYQLIVFSDYECPFCQRFWPTVETVIDEYSDNLAVTVRDYPLPMHGQIAEREAQAAQCVFKLAGNDAFWQYAGMIYERTGTNGRGIPGDKPLVAMAGELGVDGDAFGDCIANDSEVKRRVQADANAARKAGVRGTPTSVLLDTQTGQTALIRGARPLSTITSALDTLLKN